jgi:hypothetical protein
MPLPARLLAACLAIAGLAVASAAQLPKTCPVTPLFDVQNVSSRVFLDLTGAPRGHCASRVRRLAELLAHPAATAVIILVCRVVGVVFRWIGQPAVIGEIVAGASGCAAVVGDST